AFTSARSLPACLWPVFAVQFWTFWAWFAFKMFASEWMGTCVFGGRAGSPEGSPEHEQYEAGVRWANFSLMTLSGVFCASSLVQKALADCFGLQRVWCFSLVLLAVSMCLMATPGLTPWQAWLLVAVLGFPFSAAFSFPWTVVTKVAAGLESTGRITAGFNLSQCLPDFAIAFMSGPLIAASQIDSVTPVLLVGGLGAAVAAVLASRLDLEELKRTDSDVTTAELEAADPLQAQTLGLQQDARRSKK
ncbi:unnamed protein product, partial [Polarella glacialis]